MEQGELPEGFDFEMFLRQTTEVVSPELRLEQDYLQEAAGIREQYGAVMSRARTASSDSDRHRIVAFEVPHYDGRIVNGDIEMRSLVMISHIGAGCVVPGFGLVPHQRIIAKEYVRTDQGQLLMMQDFYLHGDGRASYGEDYMWVGPDAKASDLSLPFYNFSQDNLLFANKTELDSFPGHFSDLNAICDPGQSVYSDPEALQTMHQALEMGRRLLVEVRDLEPRFVQ